MAIRETGRTTGPLQTGKLSAPPAPGPLARAAGTGKLAPKAPQENEKAHAERLQAIAGKTHLGALPWEAGGAAIEFTTNYTKENRALEIKPNEPLEPFKSVKLEILEGVKGTDGGAMPPFTLTFTTGGS